MVHPTSPRRHRLPKPSASVLKEAPGAGVGLKTVPTDPDDNMVVACALKGGADYLVTDDRRDGLPIKVIRMSGYHPVQVVTPR
jgi:hypothetical protein